MNLLHPYNLPVLATVPRSGTWFLRYAISFMCHLDRGGRIDDRLTGEIFGAPQSVPFDFNRFRGGPLFDVSGTLAATRLFIGHTVCPGFASTANASWKKSIFHVRGYDYLHDGLNYAFVPMEMSATRFEAVKVAALDRSMARGKGAPIVLVYRNPIDQAASFYRYCQGHENTAYNSFQGQPLSALPFHEYLVDLALPSYAKQFVSYQAMAQAFPRGIMLVRYEDLVRDATATLARILDHLTGSRAERPRLAAAIQLARPDHLRALELELGRSLDGSRARGSHIQRTIEEGSYLTDEDTIARTCRVLKEWGIDTSLFTWPELARAETAA